MTFRLKPTTIEINLWLARRGWAPHRAQNGGRAIDAYVRRFWWLWITPRKHPPFRWSTKMTLDAMVDMIKKRENLAYFQSLELLMRPNKGRLIDYLARFWYHYEGRGRKTQPRRRKPKNPQ